MPDGSSPSTVTSKRLAAGLAAVMTICLSTLAFACPFCGTPTKPLVEQIAEVDAAILVKWLAGASAKLSDSGSTDVEIVDVMKQPGDSKLQKGARLRLMRFRQGKAGDLLLLQGVVGAGNIEWGNPFPITAIGFDYLKNSPPRDLPTTGRLKYFLKFLESPDELIGDDAFSEFANAPYADVARLAAELPREKLRAWITSSSVRAERVGLYGMMLGLCGTADDAALMERKILAPTEGFRLGIDGIMGGYLLLSGERGLAVLDSKFLQDKTAPATEAIAVLQAIRFLFQYGENRIGRDRLVESLRRLLDRPDLADMVIADLARMQDWSIQDRLIELYQAEGYESPAIKRAIVKFTLTAAKNTNPAQAPGNGDSVSAEPLPEHVVRAQKSLELLERIDPKRVQEVRRSFLRK